MAVADPIIQAGVGESETELPSVNLPDLTWDSTSVSGSYIPSANNGAIENLNFNFDASASDISGSVTGTTYNATIGVTNTPSFKIKSDKALQMGAGTDNGSGGKTYGTLQINYAKQDNVKQTFTLDLSQAKETAFRGNLIIQAHHWGTPQEFVGIFGGNLEGNLEIKASYFLKPESYRQVKTDFIFNNNSTITGDIKITGGSVNTFTFNGGGRVKLSQLEFYSDLVKTPKTLTFKSDGELEFTKDIIIENPISFFAKTVYLGSHLKVNRWDGERNPIANIEKGTTLALLARDTSLVPEKSSREINGLNLKGSSRFNLHEEQAVWSQKLSISGDNIIIDLRNPNQGKYNLLEIGTDNSNGTGLFDELNSNASFYLKIGKEGNLGGVYGTSQKNGFAASDRIIIRNAGGDSAKLRGTYSLVLDDQGASDYTYQGSGTGTETKGNVAIASVIKIANNPHPQGNTQQEKIKSLGIVSFDGAYALNSNFEVMTYNLTAAETDVKGNASGKSYITYFLDGKTNNGLYGGLKTSLSSVAFANTDLYLANLNSLNKRMGELRNNAHSQGAWGRIFVGKLSDDVGLGSETSFLTLQAGYDYAFGFEEANNYLGFALSYSNGSSKGMRGYSDSVSSLSLSSMTSHLIEFGIYNSYVSDSGWYNDSIAKFGFGMNDSKIKANLGSQMDIDTSLDSFTFALSNEVGYRVKFGGEKEFYIDPQFELGMGLISGGEMQVDGSGGQNLNATSENLFVIRSRLGASLGYDFKRWMKESEVGAILYLGGFVEDDRFFGGGYSYNDGQKVDNAIDSDTRFILNVGSNVAIKDNMRIYVDFEKGFGGKITTDYKVNAGLRYSFGENANYKNISSNERESKDTKAPIKLEEKNEGN